MRHKVLRDLNSFQASMPPFLGFGPIFKVPDGTFLIPLGHVPLSLHHIGQNLVMWSSLTAREAGK